MKATGIIVEYNPFHNGHKLHAQTARRETNADAIIAVMSGNFLQRGEPAFVDKWTRTKMALQNGVDLVFELPYAFATAHAPEFAKGAIHLLDAARCDTYYFGSEEGYIQPFKNSMALLETHHAINEKMIQTFTTEGMSYPNALNLAYKKLIEQNVTSGPFVNLTEPNNILGFHYIQAAYELNSSMTPATMKRVGARYHDETFDHQAIASATAIRKNVLENNSLTNTQQFMPDDAYELLTSYPFSFGQWEIFYPYLRMMILRDQPHKLSKIADITEGIENLIYRAALTENQFNGFMNKVKSKRYTWTRIQRMLTHILTGYTEEMRKNIPSPTYLRLLGMNQQGRTYLNQYKKELKLPLISKTSAFSDKSLACDIHATNIYALGLGNPEFINADYKKAPIFIRQ